MAGKTIHFPAAIGTHHVLEWLPEVVIGPNRETVRIQKKNRGRCVVIRFSGGQDADSVAENENKLRMWIDAKGLPKSDAVEFVGSDRLWAPNSFRRIDLLIRLQ